MTDQVSQEHSSGARAGGARGQPGRRLCAI